MTGLGHGAPRAFKSPAWIVTVETLLIELSSAAPSERALNCQQIRSRSKFSSDVPVFFCLTVTTSLCQQGHLPPVIVANDLAFRNRCANDYDLSEATS